MRETLLMQRVPALVAPHKRARSRLLHVLVADRTVVVLARGALLGGLLRCGGGRAGGFARRSRVRFAHARVREGVGRERGAVEDVLEL